MNKGHKITEPKEPDQLFFFFADQCDILTFCRISECLLAVDFCGGLDIVILLIYTKKR